MKSLDSLKCNNFICCETSLYAGEETRSIDFQTVLQQCCERSREILLLVLSCLKNILYIQKNNNWYIYFQDKNALSTEVAWPIPYHKQKKDKREMKKKLGKQLKSKRTQIFITISFLLCIHIYCNPKTEWKTKIGGCVGRIVKDE